MHKTFSASFAAVVLSACTTHPSAVDSSVNHATPDQFVPAAETDITTLAYEQRVRQRSEELLRSGQAKNLAEAERRARDELAAPATSTTSTAPKRKAKNTLDQKKLDAAADEVSRQRSQ